MSHLISLISTLNCTNRFSLFPYSFLTNLLIFNYQLNCRLKIAVSEKVIRDCQYFSVTDKKSFSTGMILILEGPTLPKKNKISLRSPTPSF